HFSPSYISQMHLCESSIPQMFCRHAPLPWSNVNTLERLPEHLVSSWVWLIKRTCGRQHNEHNERRKPPTFQIQQIVAELDEVPQSDAHFHSAPVLHGWLVICSDFLRRPRNEYGEKTCHKPYGFSDVYDLNDLILVNDD
ncbi:hypothetical protein F2P81_005552, partial [Scophthalmus maximus]